MRHSMKMALIALAMGTSTLGLGLPAMADNVTVAVGPAGGVAFGYRDGYWDRGHAWHPWENRRAAAAYRAQNRTHYYAYAHTRDHDGGWREKERYWDTH